ncbi:hypothetical protein, partial [Mycobacterium ulcerans]
RRRLPDHRFDRQPPPRPPQSTIPQLTSLLINNAGALGLSQTQVSKRRRRSGTQARSQQNRRPSAG